AGGPAEKAGLKVGDVIRSVDGKNIVSSGDLPALIGQALPGDTVSMSVWRQGESQEIKAGLGDANEKLAQAESQDTAGDQGRLGLALRPLAPNEQSQAGVKSGLLVEGVQGPAARAGVMRGDVLLAVNGVPISTVEQVRTAVAKTQKSLALLIQREGDQIIVPVRIG